MDEFLKAFRELFPDTPADEIGWDTEFKYLDDWSSMTTLTLIAMVEDNYDYILTSEQVRNSDTVEEIFEIIKNNQND